jgi:hypothetical protein
MRFSEESGSENMLVIASNNGATSSSVYREPFTIRVNAPTQATPSTNMDGILAMDTVYIVPSSIAGQPAYTGDTQERGDSILALQNWPAATVDQTTYRLFCAANSEGGLTIRTSSYWGYFNAATTYTEKTQRMWIVYPSNTSGSGHMRANIDQLDGDRVGVVTGTGAPQIVTCASITDQSRVLLSLIGGSSAIFASGISAPVVNPIQVGVSFTVTLANGAIYAWNVIG